MCVCVCVCVLASVSLVSCGGGCVCACVCAHACEYELSHSVVSDSATPWTGLLDPWAFSRQECWSGLHALLQGIFPTQGLNLRLLHCRQILYC